MEFTPENIITIIIAVLAFAPTLFQWYKYRAEGDAAHGDEAEKISAAWQKLNEPMLARIGTLETKLSATEKALSVAMDRIKRLEEENAELKEENAKLKYGKRGMLK